MNKRNEKIAEALRAAAAEFLARNAGPQSLITVTRVEVAESGTRAIVFITVLPDSAEESALEFARRQRRDFAGYFTKRVRGVRAPHLEFVLDRGEKNRQRLDELSN